MSEIQITTTQNVNINFRTADLGQRILAYIIDGLIKVAYAGVLVFVFVKLENNGGAKILPAYSKDPWGFMAVIILLGLPIIFYTLVQEILLQGQTIGKRLIKIKVVKIDGFRASFLDFFIRWVMRIIDIDFGFIFPGIIALLSIGNSKKHQRLGDMAAGTSVISLKNKVTIDHTILEEIDENYKPVYFSVIKLSDNDIRIIKENFTRAKQNNDHKTLLTLKEKVIAVIGEEPHPDISTINFLSRVLKDYNYFTANM